MTAVSAGFPEPASPLAGALVRLEPLSPAHLGGLQDAVDDGRVWDRWYTSVPRPEDMAAEIERRLALKADGEMVPFVAVRQDTDEVLGMTAFVDIDASVPRLEIGYTWNRASAHGTGTNAESKLLLLAYAFETWGAECVTLRTSWANQQSREAIARLGARQDGVLRGQRRLKSGELDDVVVFSILKHEWPSVKHRLQWRLRERTPSA
ncbi:GNAT family protein [Falsarthrobacter nasiphocae]|uniref:RimJ/RimL family protein N-acetyltransferase n=1 Tax=Falsarthrobacter nasiphocae TaxID=189863 RepID=A0AAE3YGF6_9MICC|nr:GNAT family protein [Falsarthrobacter nasiphocae]MDR6892307.1 RimJ/RimL family protein N-acetyltransferase [Falsarthrobacter nasiphocae]